jgi:hypothetical protein
MAEVSDKLPMSDRLAKWNLKYDSAHVKELMDKAKPMYLAHASTAFAQLEDVERRAKQLLDAVSVSCIQIAPYLCFSREVWKRQSNKHGETLAIAVDEMVVKWKMRGLNENLLRKTAREVFDISPPVGSLI